MHDSIVNPVKGKNSPDLGPVAFVIGSKTDLRFLCRLMNLNENNFNNLLMSKLYVGDDGHGTSFSLTGPLIGAPYAAIILETLIAWGARKILFFGWCGAISHNVKIGDIIIPTGAIIDDGTSKHYDADENSVALPSVQLVEKTRNALMENDLPFHEGTLWSTDAIYRETCEKVEYFQKKDVLAVEMETSAIFTVGRYRNVDVGGILVVSDELSTFKLQSGFKEKRFKKNRRAVCKIIGEWMK